jgi:hypothetical protein
MRLRNGDFYTNVLTQKVYRLNEDDDGSWYMSIRDEANYHETAKSSGRDMIRSIEADYKKS